MESTQLKQFYNYDNIINYSKLFKKNSEIFDIRIEKGSSTSTPIDRFGDQFIFEYLQLKSDTITSIDELKVYLKNAKIDIIIGKLCVISYHLNLLMELISPIKSENYYFIQIPSRWTIGYIDILTFYFYDVKFKLDIKNDDIFDEKNILTRFIYIENNGMRDIIKPHINTLQQYALSSENYQNTNSDIHIISLNNDYCYNVKGYFLLTDISKISSIELLINNMSRLVYNMHTINVFCKKISDNLIYIPFEDKENYQKITLESYSGSSNYRKIHDIKMKIKFKECVDSNVFIYSVGLMFLVYGNGGTPSLLEYDEVCTPNIVE